ncbi:hypothetical protein CYMTET_8520 [Cymbomonas tetramitiformis]|uniref:Uncharacterized protein n=1 Tax=Cymbomonas tetramitiformis TaxID=36881 RepID=A0AAE0LG03_9CHLO|nr:hypothetical protein CYMTET_8520 [Cymbomonas tetramitiformis]
MKSAAFMSLSAQQQKDFKNSKPDYRAIWELIPIFLAGDDSSTSVAYEWWCALYEMGGIMASNAWRVLKDVREHDAIRGSVRCADPPFHELESGTKWVICSLAEDGDGDGEVSGEWRTVGPSIKGLTGVDGTEETHYFWALRGFIAALEAKFLMKGTKEKQDFLLAKPQTAEKDGLTFVKLSTPLVNAPPAAESAEAEFLQHCAVLRRQLFDASAAKYVLRKVVNDKSKKFTGSETMASDVWARMVSELRGAFLAEHSAFAPLFDLTDATLMVRREANELLFSTLSNLVDPYSAAGSWLEASATAFPDDGKRALLEIIRRLYDSGEPMGTARELLDIAFVANVDPSENIARFNYCLRESSRRTTWNEADVKDLFLAALDKKFYAPVLDEFIRHDQREAVDLLTMQQRVMAVYAAKHTDNGKTDTALSYAATDTTVSDILDALDSLRREVRALKKGHGFTPRADKQGADAGNPSETRQARALQDPGGKNFVRGSNATNSR